jgi:hypothetical protein
MSAIIVRRGSPCPSEQRQAGASSSAVGIEQPIFDQFLQVLAAVRVIQLRSLGQQDRVDQRVGAGAGRHEALKGFGLISDVAPAVCDAGFPEQRVGSGCLWVEVHGDLQRCRPLP